MKNAREQTKPSNNESAVTMAIIPLILNLHKIYKVFIEYHSILRSCTKLRRKIAQYNDTSIRCKMQFCECIYGVPDDVMNVYNAMSTLHDVINVYNAMSTLQIQECTLYNTFLLFDVRAVLKVYSVLHNDVSVWCTIKCHECSKTIQCMVYKTVS